MRALILSVIFILSISSSLHAQQNWLWAKQGGTAVGNIQNLVRDITIDSANNIYILTTLRKDPAWSIDGNLISFYDMINLDDLFVASFTCDGAYRWGQVIDGGSADKACAIKADPFGGIYVSGQFTATFPAPAETHIGNDTMATDSSRSIFIAKFDTLGALQWVRRPESSVQGYHSFTSATAFDMNVDLNGVVRLICQLAAGSFANGAYQSILPGIHILSYDANGNFINGMPIDITRQPTVTVKMARDSISGQFYFSGHRPPGDAMTIAGNNITGTMYITSFDPQGQHLWTRINNTANNSGFFNRPVVDDSGFVYLTGAMVINDTFQMYVPVNSYSAPMQASLGILMKMDSLGNLIWATNASTENNCAPQVIAVKGEHEIVMAGNYLESMTWPGYTGIAPDHPNNGNDLFVMTWNRHTAHPIHIDTIASPNQSPELIASLASDKSGQVYLGGRSSSSIFLGTDTLSGFNKLFLIKYGFDCCIDPQPSFTFDMNNGLAYTGTQIYDSILWVIDGVDSSNSSVPPNVNGMGEHNGCVTIFTQCGSRTFCDSFFVPENVAGLSAFPELKIFPTPVTNELYINNVQAPLQYNILGISGNTIIQGILRPGNNAVNTSCLAQGVYMLCIGDGKRNGIIKIVKQ